MHFRYLLVASLLIGICNSSFSQDDEDLPVFEKRKSFYFHFKAGAGNGGHKQAEYYNGMHTAFTFVNLYSVPIIYNDINASTGYTTYLGEFPPLMRYQWSIQISGSLMYYFNPTLALYFRFNGSRNASSGLFTLYADNPANPFGEPLIFNQEMRGLELRTWYIPGIRVESEPLEKGEINPFFELGIVAGGIKPIRNEAIVEGKKYNLFTYNTNLATDTKLKPGFGLNANLGLISWIKPHMAVELSAELIWVKLRILQNVPNAYFIGFYVGFLI
jgi:hypothetical protein